MDQSAFAAERRFPSRKQAIEERAARDEEFRDLCIDFADAEAELQRWEQSINPKREERCAEYAELVNDLAREIEAALDTAEIIPFHKRWPKLCI
jgi:phage host-nuclease inhibitor protein Gam